MRHLHTLLLSLALAPVPGRGVEDPAQKLFAERVGPLLRERCVICHNADAKSGGLDMSTREAFLRGGDNGPALEPGNARASLLYKVVAYEREPHMPRGSTKLPDESIAAIAEWIDGGAPYAAAAQSGTPALPPEAGLKLFTERVRGILESQCFPCHGGKLKQAGFSMATREALLRGSDNGAVVIPGDGGASLLVKKIRHESQPGMPYQGQKLRGDEIAAIVDWVNAAAPYDKPLVLPANADEILARLPGNGHWAFKLPRRPPVPAVKDRGWVRNPIDAFIAAEHEKHGLRPLPPAGKRTLIRRVYLDLIGLPPKPEEIRAFLADNSPGAYEKVVDRLLASPQYGERWGRHWMDVWRYSDWYGTPSEVRNSAQYIWHWRDWIIDSLNKDKGYDRMIVEMLAGDELEPANPDVLRATGYLARNWFRFNRNVTLQDTVEHTSTAFLGLTFKCARCHDHKYDPIAQEDYYKLRAFFEPFDLRIDRVPGVADASGTRRRLRKPTRAPSDERDGLPRVYDADPREPLNEEPFAPAIFPQTFRFVRGDERNPDREHPLPPGLPEIFRAKVKIEPVALPLEAYYPNIRSQVDQDLIAEAKAEVSKAEESLSKANEALVEARNRTAVAASDGREESPPAGPGVGFEKEIKPIFEKNCFFCHKSSNEKSGLSLETEETVLQGGVLNGPAAIPRRSKESPLIQRLRGEKKPRMPLGGPALPEDDIRKIVRWIDQLPEDKPQVALRKAESGVLLSEKGLAASRANLAAVEARVAAEEAKYADPPGPKADELAKAARKAERQAYLLQAEEEVLSAQQKLGEALNDATADDKTREKRVAAARKQLEIAQAALGQATESYTPLGRIYPKTSSGRRLALARWIASRENPLTARVAVNHIWLRHFGKALVPTVANFGRNGRPPTHPELLDWLAVELMETNWSMKALHRLMVISNTYRMQSAVASHPNLAIDAENRYLWRMNARRMEAETVRDSLLYVAGELDLTMGGPELDDALGEAYRRRSLYFRTSADTQMLFLKLFDMADARDCYERAESVVPQQALALSNSKLSRAVARALARKLGEKTPAPAFIDAAFETVLGRPASAGERNESERFLAQQAELFRDPAKLTAFRGGAASEVPPATDPAVRAREDLVHVLFSHNEFVVIR